MRTRHLLHLRGCCVLGLLLAISACSNTTSSTSPQIPAAGGAMPAGAVAPTEESIQTGQYKPLSRPLFIYVNKASLKKPAVAEYVRYYLSDEGQALVPEVGYVKLHDPELAESRRRFEEALQSVGAGAAAGAVEGEVLIDGSSTVAPISSAISEEFHGVHPKVRAGVKTAGTGGGFKRFVQGEIDICDASRPIKSTEADACKAANVEYLELPVAIDGLTVVVNPGNDWVAGMTIEQLKQIWSPDSGVTRWNEVDPSWPAEPIKLFGPGTDSGTFEYFTEAVVGESRKSRADYQASENDNILVTGVAGEKYALGYFGYAYYVENQDKLKPLAIAP